MTTFENAFERNPKIAGGQPVLRGTRVPLRTVLASLAEGQLARAQRTAGVICLKLDETLPTRLVRPANPLPKPD